MTTDRVIVAASRLDAKAAYVACSRGRTACTVHTPDKAALLGSLPSGDRPLVVEKVALVSLLDARETPPAPALELVGVATSPGPWSMDFRPSVTCQATTHFNNTYNRKPSPMSVEPPFEVVTESGGRAMLAFITPAGAFAWPWHALKALRLSPQADALFFDFLAHSVEVTRADSAHSPMLSCAMRVGIDPRRTQRAMFFISNIRILGDPSLGWIQPLGRQVAVNRKAAAWRPTRAGAFWARRLWVSCRLYPRRPASDARGRRNRERLREPWFLRPPNRLRRLSGLCRGELGHAQRPAQRKQCEEVMACTCPLFRCYGRADLMARASSSICATIPIVWMAAWASCFVTVDNQGLPCPVPCLFRSVLMAQVQMAL